MKKFVKFELVVTYIVATVLFAPIPVMIAANAQQRNEQHVIAQRNGRVEVLKLKIAKRKVEIAKEKKLKAELEAKKKEQLLAAIKEGQILAAKKRQQQLAAKKLVAYTSPAKRPQRSSRGGAVRTMRVASGMSGKASWYSFSRNHGMFAAMRGYRGRSVRVSGPRGSVIVKINDYGPAKWTGRIIDLSAESFKATVGPLSRGVGWVKIEILN